MTDITIDEEIAAAPGPATPSGDPSGDGSGGIDVGGGDDGGGDDGGETTVEGTGRRGLGWRQVLAAGLVCFALWFLLDAPTLLRSAEASPFGVRRTVAVDVLRPVASFDRALGLSHVVGAADRVMGRTGMGVVQLSRSVPRSARHSARPEQLAVSSSPGGHGPALAPDGFPQLAQPTNADPLHVLVVGDSLGVDLSSPLVDDLVATGVVDAAADAHIDTGLSRPDYFDWPAELSNDLARYSPQVVVVFMGANDPQNLVVDGNAVSFGTAAWSTAYGARVSAFAKEATDTGARVILVGMPPMADPGLSAAMQVVNQQFALAARVPGVTYFASSNALADPSGAFATYLPDASGNEIQVREPDGTHITPAGADRLSQAIIGEMERALAVHFQP